MNPRIKKLLGCAAIAALIAAGPNLNAKEGEMPKNMMRYYGGFEIEDMFDASQWFARGMYRTRNIEADGGASNVTMLRSQPKPFTREQLSELPYAAAEAFDAGYLEGVDIEAFVLNPPDLSHRIRYAYSAFAEPNRPEDYYYLYLDLAGRRFAVTFSRDAQTGDNLTGKAAKEISGDYASQAEHRKAFAEIDEFERKAR